ncbi:DUF721 domain-containing protein [Nocardioides sp. CBS4Y-1]|uniref:DUF721 domain-containing protein n=1 Tax=Nocardioides acrostichi TaxID=2784339 RepID=A0A930V566_9ACTN|nr:DUF721 domain-containing protein [Nocardioides acrostichi]
MAQGPAEDEGEEHRTDGLDLARRAARSLAAAGGEPARRRPGRRPTGAPKAGRRGRPDDRDPQLLDGSLSRLVSDRGWELDLRVHGIFGRWPTLVGEEIAAHSTPETFDDGRLVLRTDSTAWATQLRLLTPQLIARLADELGAGTVASIEVLGPHGPSWRKGPRSVRDGRGPRDTYG